MFGLSKHPPEPTHVAGAHKGEELVLKKGREAGRRDGTPHRTARDSTSINPRGERPIDSAMPHMPPA